MKPTTKKKAPAKLSVSQFRKKIESGEFEIKNGRLIEKADCPTSEDLAAFDKEPPKDLFGGTGKAPKELTRIKLLIPGEPMPKQSTRFGAARYRSEGQHFCPRRKINVKHLKGDVMTFINKYNQSLDVNIQTYQPAELNKEKERIIKVIYSQLAELEDFRMFTEEVHILRMDYVFPILKSFSKKKVKEIEDGIIHFKTTKPDLPDNLKKLPFDAMSGMVYKDDALICSENGYRKRYGVNPGLLVELEGR